MLKTLRAAGISCECFEAADDVGGNWYFGAESGGVYESTHLISSKRHTEFRDFPMPDDYPAYPSHRQVLQYLRAYSRHFELYDDIHFGSRVRSVKPTSDHWSMTLENQPERERVFDAVVVANGHHWSYTVPPLPGEFSGTIIHSRDYRTPDILEGRRVLVVGIGSSGSDIAVEAGRHAKATFVAVRRGKHFVPKFMMGEPNDASGDWVFRWRIPYWGLRGLAYLPNLFAVGKPGHYGLPTPDHKFMDELPIPNPEFLNSLGQGTVLVKPAIQGLNGDSVTFVDGSTEKIDVIVFATGYCVGFPFFDELPFEWVDGVPRLVARAIHPEHHNLFFAGLFDPTTKMWQLVEHQAELFASVLRANDAGLAWLRKLQSPGKSIGGLPGGRELEIEFYAYRRGLRRIVRRLSRMQ